jgi:hypothetical protein
MIWMVRKEGLTEEQNLLLDRWELLERKDQTRYLPEHAVAVVFNGNPLDMLNCKMYVIEDRT